MSSKGPKDCIGSQSTAARQGLRAQDEPAGVFHSQAVTCGTQVRGEDLAFTASSNGRSLVDRRNTRHTASQSSAVPVCPG